MDQFDRKRKPRAPERFLGVSSHAPLLVQNTGDELQEDDVVFFGYDYSAVTNPSTPSSSPSTSSTSSSLSVTPIHHLHRFGILAALPENETSSNYRTVGKLYRKATSSRVIPAIPKPPPAWTYRYYQSAPVDVPMISEELMNARRRYYEKKEEEEEEEEEEEGEMLPPHEIVARNSAKSHVLAHSVLEGVGRTLKGRDMRQVRNAVWRQTGFLD